MLKLSHIKNLHMGQPAAILGGGPSLLYDIPRLPQEFIEFAVNEHPFQVGITNPDYLVFMDDPNDNPRLMRAIAGSKGTPVTFNLHYTDIDLRGVPDAIYRGSGIIAAWLALWMGCDPVYLCGMDLYQGEKKYCHAENDYQDLPIYQTPLEEHYKRWRTLPHQERLKPLSGPLTTIF